MSKFFRGDVYFALYPYDDDLDKNKPRPVIVLDEEKLEVLVVKVTSQEKKDNDDLDIIYWKEAGLNKPSVARVSKTITIAEKDMIHFIGKIHDDDMINILEYFYR